MGHPCNATLKHVCKQLNVDNKNEVDLFCEDCKLGKMHQKSFVPVQHHTNSPLELLHCDVWGPASVISHDGFQYYLPIVDDFTRYSWIYPLCLKSDVAIVIPRFISMVERQFQKKVRSFQSDMGGEFVALNSLFKRLGILHRFSCPYTHQQNGLVERKHQHVVELGLSMLAKGVLPMKFWWNAFTTAVHLINILLTPTLQMVPISGFVQSIPYLFSFKSVWQCLLAFSSPI